MDGRCPFASSGRFTELPRTL